MTAIFTGVGAGLTRSSGTILGGAGQLGTASLGRGGDQVAVNAATGNLVISRQDEFLVGRGPDVALSRTYNSLAELPDRDNDDQWQMGTARRVLGLTGTLNTAGSTITRQSADGAAVVYTYGVRDGVSAYWTTDGDGSHDKLVKSGATWIWTNESSQVTETYEVSVGSTSVFRIKQATDPDGTKLTFSYVSATDKIYRITTQNHGTANAATGIAEQSYIQYTWSGNNVTLITTGFTDYGASSSGADDVNKTQTRTRYSYDGSNRLTTVTVDLSPSDNSIADGKTYVTGYTYHGTSKRIATITQTDGTSLTVAYDVSGRVETLTSTVATGEVRITNLSYGAGYTVVTAPNGQTTRLDYDAAKRLTKITAPPAYSGASAQTIQFSYDADGNLQSVTDAANAVTGYTYDADGNLLTSADPDGNSVVRTYGAKNQLLTEKHTGAGIIGSPNNTPARFAYDASNRLRYQISAEGHVTEYRYNSSGQVQTVVKYPEHSYPAGAGAPTETAMNTWRDAITDKRSVQITAYLYDGRGNQLQATQYGSATTAGAGTTTDGSIHTYSTYDQTGSLLNRHTGSQNSETFVHDGLGRVVSAVDISGGTTSFVFNDAAMQTVVTLASGLVQTSTYNKVGELVAFAESATPSPLATALGTATYRYDTLGRLRWQSDATGRKSYFLYDAVGRKVMDISSAGDVIEYRYDARNRMVSRTSYATRLTGAQVSALDDANAAINFADYRPPASASSAPSQDLWTWYVYDSADRLLQTIDTLGQTSINTYDAAGRLLKTTSYAGDVNSKLIDPAQFGATYDNSQDDGPALLLAIAHANSLATLEFLCHHWRTAEPHSCGQYRANDGRRGAIPRVPHRAGFCRPTP